MVKASKRDAKVRARESSRRYRARMRGESVPKLRRGRPPKPLAKATWESFAVPDNRAAYLGNLNGFTRWELADQGGSVLPCRFREGAETSAALHRFFGRYMMTAVVRGKDKELAALCRQAAESPVAHADDPSYFPEMYSADSSIENRAAISALVEQMIHATLMIAYEYFEYGRFLNEKERIKEETAVVMTTKAP
jgi:hypothetical protein